MHELGKTQEQSNRMLKIKNNLVKVSEHVKEKIKELKKLVATREEERLKYDHYRNKLVKMETEGKSSTSNNIKDQEKYANNSVKFDQCKLVFEDLTNQVNEKLLKVEGKIELVTLDLTLKFSKEVQLGLFRYMN